MSNPYYNNSGAPSTSSFGYSAAIRGEFANIAAGFALLPPALTANKAVIINSGGTGMTVSAGSLTLTKDLTVSNTLTFTGTDGSSVNFGTGGTVLYAGATYVNSLAGTTNEITASASTGAVMLSLPAALTFTGKTVTGGTFASPTLSGNVAGTPTFSSALTFGSTTQFNDTANFASGKGITFNGGSLLSAYNEGTFTVTDNSGASLAITSSLFYRRIGNSYLMWGEVAYPSTASGAGAALAGFPFTAKANGFAINSWYIPVMFTNGLFGGGNTPTFLGLTQNTVTAIFRDSGGSTILNSTLATWRMYLSASIPI